MMNHTFETNHASNYYPPESAGRIMVTNVPCIFSHESIREVEDMLIKKAQDFNTINYVYVLGRDKKIQGVLSVKDVFRCPKETRVADVMVKDIIAAHVHTDQEHVARLALKHNIKAVPVIDKNSIFLGVVPSDVILKVLHDEHNEDLMYEVGINKINSAASIIHSRLRSLVWARLPWLILGLLGGILAAYVVGSFERLLEAQIALALFIPVIVYMSDAVGSQSQTIFIRAMALDHNFSTKKYVLREIKVGSLIALIIAFLLAVIIWIWKGSIALTVTLGLSIALTIILSVIIALLIPLTLIKLKRDTAVGSGPFATILRDLMSIIIYFYIAQVMLSAFSS